MLCSVIPLEVSVVEVTFLKYISNSQEKKEIQVLQKISVLGPENI